MAAPEHGRLQILATHALAGDITHLRIAGQRAYLAVAGEGVRIFDLNDGAASEIAHIPLAGRVHDLQLDETTLYAVMDAAQVYAIDVADPAQWRIRNRYEAPGTVAEWLGAATSST